MGLRGFLLLLLEGGVGITGLYLEPFIKLTAPVRGVDISLLRVSGFGRALTACSRACCNCCCFSSSLTSCCAKSCCNRSFSTSTSNFCSNSSCFRCSDIPLPAADSFIRARSLSLTPDMVEHLETEQSSGGRDKSGRPLPMVSCTVGCKQQWDTGCFKALLQ